jgi:hypothetical protein
MITDLLIDRKGFLSAGRQNFFILSTFFIHRLKIFLLLFSVFCVIMSMMQFFVFTMLLPIFPQKCAVEIFTIYVLLFTAFYVIISMIKLFKK